MAGVNHRAKGRLAALAVVTGVALFWLGVFAGGAVQPGYDHSRDFVSYLASHGARLPGIGIVAITSFGVSYLALAYLLVRPLRAPVAAVMSALAGLANFVIAAFRLHCPAGAARCGAGQGVSGGGSSDVMHGLAVGGHEAFVVLAMIGLGVALLRRQEVTGSERTAAVGTGVFCLIAAAISPALLLWATAAGGRAQRLWVLWHCLWLAVVLGLAHVSSPDRPIGAGSRFLHRLSGLTAHQWR
jgi:Protein of unknown function (DUF998)